MTASGGARRQPGSCARRPRQLPYRASRCATGPELTAKALLIEPGNPWENGCRESFTGKLRDELLDREIFSTLREAQVLVEAWRRHDTTVRPHSALGYRPPAPE